jgi:hypothetical protein
VRRSKTDLDGQVHPGRGGMSVVPDDPARLPPHFRPVALGGFGKLPVFGVEATRLGEKLFYRPDPKKPTRHGFVEPSAVMTIAAYQIAIAATAPVWQEVV